ncbi:MAG: hypothetical protein J5494_06575, partial [Candidatus Methanomethylophilaceae archaeon]|nr:hypothetical protein [Candidatus Methanomethylophilaceae archaeon]
MGSIRSYDDWTGNIIPGADIRSLDPEAVAALRAVYSLRNPESDVVPETDPAVFLSKTGFLKKRKIT